MALVSLRLRSGLLRMLLAAIASITLLHCFTAVHAAVAVPVCAAIAHIRMALMLTSCAALHLAMLHLAMLSMLLPLRVRHGAHVMRGHRCSLRSGGKRERQSDRGNEYFHLVSPERPIERKSTEVSGEAWRGCIRLGVKAI